MYFITTPTRDMMPIFSLPELALNAARQLERAVSEANASTYGYSILPDCLYAMIGFRGMHDLGEFVYEFKWLSSRAIIGLEHGPYHEQLYRKGKFKPWMNRFDRQEISTREQFNSRLEYIHNEPVRRCLVENMIDYEFSSARDWIIDKPGIILIEKRLSMFAWGG